MNNVMKMEMTNEISPYRLSSPGHGRGFNSVGRGKTLGSNPFEPTSRYPNPWHQYPTGYRQPLPPVTAFQSYAQNPAGPVFYRPTTVLTPASNYANGSHQRATHCVQNSFWSSRSGGVVAENCSWRPVVSSRPSDGNNHQSMGRGRGTGHYRPSTYDRSSSSQYPNQRDPNRW